MSSGSLFAALEKSTAHRWEANGRAGQWLAAFVALTSVLAMTQSLTLGVASLASSIAFFGWFTLARITTGRLQHAIQQSTPALALSIPAMSVLLVTVTVDAQTAFALWLAPVVTVTVIGLSAARLEPTKPLVYAIVASLLYVAAYVFLVKELPPGVIERTPQLQPFEQVSRVSFLLGSGVAHFFGRRGLRAALKRAEQSARADHLFGKYRLGSAIASGGMATVVNATYCPEGGFARPVAVKRIHAHLATDAEIVSSFRTEAELGSRLVHPNIVAVLDFGRVDDTYFLAMEHVDGVDLRALLSRLKKRGQRLPPALAGFIAHEMLQGLQFAHAGARGSDGELLRVVHRDLSPGNVLLARSGDVKVTDFGIACALKDAARHQTGRLVGSLAYLAPEQAAQRSFDHRADLFAVATLLHEMLSMRRLFKRETAAHTLMAILNDPIPSVGPFASRAWDAFLARALARDPAARFASARAMADALAALLVDLSATDGAAPTMPTGDDLARFLRSTRALEPIADQSREPTQLDSAVLARRARRAEAQAHAAPLALAPPATPPPPPLDPIDPIEQLLAHFDSAAAPTAPARRLEAIASEKNLVPRVNEPNATPLVVRSDDDETALPPELLREATHDLVVRDDHDHTVRERAQRAVSSHNSQSTARWGRRALPLPTSVPRLAPTMIENREDDSSLATERRPRPQ